MLFVFAVLFYGCIFSTSEKTKEYPSIWSVSISNGDVFNTRDITVLWNGNEFVDYYQYSIDSLFSDWTDSIGVELTDLDEGEHVFTLEARHDSVFTGLTTIHFTIDAVTGPGLILSPRKITENSYINLNFEDVSSLMAAHIEIVCNNNSAHLSGFTQIDADIGEGMIVSFSDESDASLLIIDIAFPGAAQGVEGSFRIGTFLALVVKNTGYISIDPEKTEFRDIENNIISLSGFDMVRIEK